MESGLSQLVDEEADRLEADPAETEPDPDDSEDGDEGNESFADMQPPPPAAIDRGIGPDEIRRAERATTAQRKKLALILGDEFVAHECIFCSALGFVPELPPAGTRLEIVPDQDGVTWRAEPPAEAIPLLEAPDKARCPECDGWGEVLSGSRAQHGMVTPCSKCAGNGWVTIARSEPTIQAYVPPPAAPVGQVAVAIQNGAPDAWGRAAGHPHWGQHPASIPA